MAPEVVNTNNLAGHDLAVDWWSVGVLIIELLSGQSPFSQEGDANSQSHISDRILHKPPTIPASIGRDAKDLIHRLLQKSPKKRLGSRNDAVDIKSHRFFRDLNWKHLEDKLYAAPYIPDLNSSDDTSNFSDEFTSQEAVDEISETPAFADYLFRGNFFL